MKVGKMRNGSKKMAWLLLLSVLFTTDKEPASRNSSLTLTQLKQTRIIGSLGVPIGEIMRLEATVVSGTGLRKDGGGKYYLKVSKVNGQSLASSILMGFRVPTYGNTSFGHTIKSFEAALQRHDPDVSLRDFETRRKIELEHLRDPREIWAVGRLEIIGEREPYPDWFQQGGQSGGYHVRDSLYVLKEIGKTGKTTVIPGKH